MRKIWKAIKETKKLALGFEEDGGLELDEKMKDFG